MPLARIFMTTLKKVLIIDDCPINAFLSQKALAEFNEEIRTKTINFPQQALDYLKSILETSKNNLNAFKPDIVLLDLHMPQMNGFQLLEELEKNETFIQNPIDIYMLSSSCLERDIQTALNKRLCQGFITKPLNQIKLNTLFR